MRLATHGCHLYQEHINKGFVSSHAFSMHADFSAVRHAAPLLSTDRIQQAAQLYSYRYSTARYSTAVQLYSYSTARTMAMYGLL